MGWVVDHIPLQGCWGRAGVAPRLADGPHFLIDGHEYSYLARAGGAAKLCRTYDEALEFVEARSHDW